MIPIPKCNCALCHWMWEKKYRKEKEKKNGLPVDVFNMISEFN